MTAIVGLLLTGCTGIRTAPTPEARQALAPTGNLRVGLYLGNPLSVTRDSGSGEMKGMGFDLGKELARRMGIPFEPVVYPSIGAVVDSAQREIRPMGRRFHYGGYWAGEGHGSDRAARGNRTRLPRTKRLVHLNCG